jgi:hypothetical protein
LPQPSAEQRIGDVEELGRYDAGERRAIRRLPGALADVRLTFLKIERRWDPLRSDARFASLAKRMALQ